MNKIEFKNGSIIETIDDAEENTRSKRGQEQINNKKDIDEIYCFNWYKNMYLRQGCSESDANNRARIDLNYQLSLYKMYELFGIEEDNKFN